jgi:hypothetical protein
VGAKRIVTLHCPEGTMLAVVQLVPASVKPPPLTETVFIPNGTMPVFANSRVSSELL